jgi:hypothetical protein
MHDITRDFLVSLAAFATLFGIVYVVAITRYRERMAMLEKGLNPSSFNSKSHTLSSTLKFGMLCVGIAVGILAGSLLAKNEIMDKTPAYMAMTFLFGGLSLILDFVIQRKLNK